MSPTNPGTRRRRQVAIVTGANTGIGRVTARELARRGAHVIIASRSAERAQPVIDEIRAVAANGSVESCRSTSATSSPFALCAGILRANLPLHLLINNAGLAGSRGGQRRGFELAFGVNHVGHFLLTQLLWTASALSPRPHRHRGQPRALSRQRHRLDTFASGPGAPRHLLNTGVSELANVLFSAELGRRLQRHGSPLTPLHPGVAGIRTYGERVPWPLRSLMKLGDDLNLRRAR